MAGSPSKPSKRAAAADVAVVLGAAVWRGGKPSPPLRNRTQAGVALLHSGAVRVLLLTGGLGRYPPAEAELMAQLALEQGVARERLVLESTAKNTWQSARACAAIIRHRGWRQVVLVSDGYHLPRARLVFRHFGIDAGAAAAGWPAGVTALGRWRCYGRELLALSWYAVKLLALRAGGRRR